MPSQKKRKTRPPLFPKLGKVKKPSQPKVYLRRLITFEKRLLTQLIKNPAERKLAIQAMSLMNTAYFYDRITEVTVSEYLGFLEGVKNFMHSPAVFNEYVRRGFKEADINSWQQENLDRPYAIEKKSLQGRRPKETILVRTESFRAVLEDFFNNLLRKNRAYTKYNERLKEAKTLLGDFKTARQIMGVERFEDDIPL